MRRDTKSIHPLTAVVKVLDAEGSTRKVIQKLKSISFDKETIQKLDLEVLDTLMHHLLYTRSEVVRQFFVNFLCQALTLAEKSQLLNDYFADMDHLREMIAAVLQQPHDQQLLRLLQIIKTNVKLDGTVSAYLGSILTITAYPKEKSDAGVEDETPPATGAAAESLSSRTVSVSSLGSQSVFSERVVDICLEPRRLVTQSAPTIPDASEPRNLLDRAGSCRV